MSPRNSQPVRRRRSGLRRLVIAVLTPALLWLGGLMWYVGQIPTSGPTGAGNTGAIVVLTGGADRVREGLRLLAEGRAVKLLVSGVHRDVDLGALLRTAARLPDKMECCVTLDYAAFNTAGNARETAEWMIEHGFRSLRLVTANYHMPRSLLEFRRAMPEIEILPHPVFPSWFRRADWWRWRKPLTIVVREYVKFLAALAGLGPGRGESPDRANAG